MEKAIEFPLPVPWGHIAVKAWGNPTNFPVLCVHGLLDNAGAFDRLIAQLPKHYYYVSIDLPGHGFSSHFPSGIPLNFFNYVLSIKYIVEKLNWKFFKFIGHSLGSQLGTFYSILYPNQIQAMILVEGLIASPRRNREIVPRIRRSLDLTFESHNQTKHHLYSYDDIMYTLKYRRQNCLSTDAAEAIFNRSVTQVGQLFKYNRDIRLKDFILPIFNMSQWASILSNLKVKILLLFTTGTYDSLTRNQDSLSIEAITNLSTSFSNIKLVTGILGNHDVHNNNPGRLSYEISKFLDEQNISSKL